MLYLYGKCALHCPLTTDLRQLLYLLYYIVMLFYLIVYLTYVIGCGFYGDSWVVGADGGYFSGGGVRRDILNLSTFV